MDEKQPQHQAVLFVAIVQGPAESALAVVTSFAKVAKALIQEHGLQLVTFHSEVNEITARQSAEFVNKSAQGVALAEELGIETHVLGTHEPVDIAKRNQKAKEN